MKPKVQITLKPWIQRKIQAVSRELEGIILAESEKAIHFEGTIAIRESQHCFNCGRQIENFKSRWVGYGPICSERLGIDRPDTLTEEQKNIIREQIQKKHQMRVWLPKSQITVIYPQPELSLKFTWEKGDAQAVLLSNSQ